MFAHIFKDNHLIKQPVPPAASSEHVQIFLITRFTKEYNIFNIATWKQRFVSCWHNKSNIVLNPICADLNNACSLNSNSLSGSNFLCSCKTKNPLTAKTKVPLCRRRWEQKEWRRRIKERWTYQIDSGRDSAEREVNDKKRQAGKVQGVSSMFQ